MSYKNAWPQQPQHNIIREIHDEEGMSVKFSNILEQKNFFSESFFYQFLGYLENVFCIIKYLLKFHREKFRNKIMVLIKEKSW